MKKKQPSRLRHPGCKIIAIYPTAETHAKIRVAAAMEGMNMKEFCLRAATEAAAKLVK